MILESALLVNPVPTPSPTLKKIKMWMGVRVGAGKDSETNLAEAVEVLGIPLEETPQLEAEALAVGEVVTPKGIEKTKIAATSHQKDQVAKKKRNNACGS